jgi:choice-of-anchor C domain-containing protein
MKEEQNMFKKNTIWLVILTFAAAISLPAHLAAGETENLIQNGSFEIYAKDSGAWSVAGAIDFDLDVGNTDIAGWTVINGKIDYIQQSSYTWNAAEGNRSLDLCGTPGSGGVSQTFDTVAGEMYKVQFSMSGSPMTGWSGEDIPNKTLRIQAAGRSADFAYDMAVEQNSYEDMKWKLCSFFFVADSDTTTLEIFSTMEPVHIGPVIDNVSVVSASDWSPAGTYMGSDNQGEQLLVTIIPLGPDNTRFATVRDVLNSNPGWEARHLARGEMIQTGPNEYAATQVAYVTGENFSLLFRGVVSGTIVQTGPDTLETTWALALYTPDQDPFADDAEPAMCFPGVKGSLRRVPIVDPCVPPAAP